MTIAVAAETATPAPPIGEPDFEARLAAACARARAFVEAPIEATFLPKDTSPYVSRRADGWSAPAQRAFLEAIVEGHGVDAACRRVGLSVASAYAFRRSAKGAPFALAWRAATLLARECVAETLMVRALEGQVDTYTRADGTAVTRHRHDNRLGLSLLRRLDRQVEAAPDADIHAARLVAQEFDAFLDLIEREAGAAHAGLFLARRADPGEGGGRDLDPIYALAAADRLVRTGVATAAEVDVSDLDPTARQHWTGEQWARAEAAGLVAIATPARPEPPEPAPAPKPETAPAPQLIQHSRAAMGWGNAWLDDDDELFDRRIWWDDVEDAWRTSFPPRDGFLGEEEGDPADPRYERALDDEEAALMGGNPDHFTPEELADRARDRDALFAALAARLARQPAPAAALSD